MSEMDLLCYKAYSDNWETRKYQIKRYTMGSKKAERSAQKSKHCPVSWARTLLCMNPPEIAPKGHKKN